jgi:hypothetical protein
MSGKKSNVFVVGNRYLISSGGLQCVFEIEVLEVCRDFVKVRYGSGTNAGQIHWRTAAELDIAAGLPTCNGSAIDSLVSPQKLLKPQVSVRESTPCACFKNKE